METTNKIKFIDEDGSIELLDPPMTSRIHSPSQKEEMFALQTEPEAIKREEKLKREEIIQEEQSPEEVKEPSVENDTIEEPVIVEDAVEHNIKNLEAMNELLTLTEPQEEIFAKQTEPEAIKREEEKSVPETDREEEIDKEALNVVVNAVSNVNVPKSISPKGCCIIQ